MSSNRLGVALIIVGHRPSTLSVADKVLFLKEGRAAMFGQRDQVLKRSKSARRSRCRKATAAKGDAASRRATVRQAASAATPRP